MGYCGAIRVDQATSDIARRAFRFELTVELPHAAAGDDTRLHNCPYDRSDRTTYTVARWRGQTSCIRNARLAAFKRFADTCRRSVPMRNSGHLQFFQAGDDDYRRTRVATSKGFQHQDAMHTWIEVDDSCRRCGHHGHRRHPIFRRAGVASETRWNNSGLAGLFLLRS